MVLKQSVQSACVQADAKLNALLTDTALGYNTTKQLAEYIAFIALLISQAEHWK